MPDSLIKLEKLSLTYPHQEIPVFSNISITIEPRKFYAIVGANGRGKTTLCRILADLIPSFYKGKLSGHISRQVDSSDVQYVGDHPDSQLSGVSRTVRHELAFGLENHGHNPKIIREKVDYWAHLLGITPWLDTSPHNLSGGLKQKVAICASLIIQPKLLILDEPTSQLDPSGTQMIFELLKQLKVDADHGVIVSEHKINALTSVAEEFIPLDLPEVCRTYSARELLDKDIVDIAGFPLPSWVTAQLMLDGPGVETWHTTPSDFQSSIKKVVNK